MDTPGTQGLIGCVHRNLYDLSDVAIESENHYAQIYVTSLGKEDTIADAGSLLITTMARHVDKGTVFDALAERPIVIPPAQQGPLMIEPVRATIKLKGRRSARVFALDHDGRKQPDAMEIPVTRTKDGISFTVDGAESKTVYYVVELE